MKPVKRADGYLAMGIEGPATVQEFEALKAKAAETQRRNIQTHARKLQAEMPSYDELTQRHAAALAEIDRLRAALERTGGALFSTNFLAQEVGAQNQKRSRSVHGKGIQQKRFNRLWAQVFQWLEAHGDTAKTNKALALSVPFDAGNKLKLDKDYPGQGLVLDTVEREIGNWKRGKWSKAKE